jgi:nicotinic acid mononucleotide adenylyltransferase
MDCLMLIMKQGNIADPRKIAQLEERLEMLEKLVKELQSEQRPRMGRPPKVNDEQAKQQEASASLGA